MRKALPAFKVKADLHIHTLLSPCGDIEMTPAAIVGKALQRGLSVIGITDHNSTMQAPIIKELGTRNGLHVICGAEVTTKEEVHVLVFVDGSENLGLLQEYLSSNLVKVQNDPDFFGYQLVVDENEKVLYQEENLLIGAINKSLDQVVDFVHALGGMVIPAHIDKKANSLISQLGFIPPGLDVDAFELSPKCDAPHFLQKNKLVSKRGFICSSDAHFPEDIGKYCTELDIPVFSFEAVAIAIRGSSVGQFVYNDI